MKLKKVKGEKPLEDIINHLLSRIEKLEVENMNLQKQLFEIDSELSVLTEAVFESGPLGEYDA